MWLCAPPGQAQGQSTQGPATPPLQCTVTSHHAVTVTGFGLGPHSLTSTRLLSVHTSGRGRPDAGADGERRFSRATHPADNAAPGRVNTDPCAPGSGPQLLSEWLPLHFLLAWLLLTLPSSRSHNAAFAAPSTPRPRVSRCQLGKDMTPKMAFEASRNGLSRLAALRLHCARLPILLRLALRFPRSTLLLISMATANCAQKRPLFSSQPDLVQMSPLV